jgi:hypothetical protein
MVTALLAGTAMASTIPPDTTIPFELVNKHIVIDVRAGGRPLSFVLDTGDRYAVIDLDRAKELGMSLGREVQAVGAGAQSTTGAFVQDSTFTIPGIPGFYQPLTLALPLKDLSPRLGQNLDGIIGADFIRQFVVELDYQAKVIRLQGKDAFKYSGPGESIPIDLNVAGHPIVEAELTPTGGDPIKGKFVLDIGSGGPLALYSPFVAAHHLPEPGVKAIKGLAGGGTGGQVTGQTGRVAQLKIGNFRLNNPIAFFFEDKAGAFASSAIAGNIGEQVLSRFKLYLDYSHNRVILEPNSTFVKPFDYTSGGLRIEVEGKDYKTFRIKEVLGNSPAAEAGLRENDVIDAIDGRPVSESTLSAVLEMFERPVPYRLAVRRGQQTLDVTLTPRTLL